MDGAQSDGSGDNEAHGFDHREQSFWVKILELYQSNIGLLLIIGSQVFGVGMNTCVKILQSFDPPVPPFEIVFIRQIVTYFVSLYFLIRQGVPYPFTGPPNVRILLGLRGTFGFIALFGVYYSLQYLSLPDAITITFLTPTTTAIVAYLLLGEQLARSGLVAGFCSLLGVILIARPEFIFGHHLSGESESIREVTSSQRLSAVAMALLGVLGATGAFCSIRAIGKRASPLHLVTFFSLWSCIASFSGMLILKTPIVWPDGISWVLLMIAISLCGFTAQICLTMGLQRETASRGSLATYTQVVFAEISDRIIFHSEPSVLGLIGTAIILTSALYVAFMKSRKAPGEATGYIRIHSRDKRGERGIERLPLGTNDTVHEELRGLVSDDYSERSTLDLEDGRESMENV